MLTQPQVQRYSTESGLRDIMIAEKEVVFLLQLLSERGILGSLAFKGGTCLGKMFIGSQGGFQPTSTSPGSRSTITKTSSSLLGRGNFPSPYETKCLLSGVAQDGDN